MAARPKREHVVKALMTQQSDVVKTITTRKGNARSVTCWAYSCPRNLNCKNTPPVVSFEKGTGYTNPYSHLVSCVAGGNETKLLELYRARSSLSGGNREDGRISSYFTTALSSTDRERAIYHYIDVIVSLSLPITYVEKSRFREFSKFDERISVKAFRETVFKLVEVVESGVKNDLKDTRGAVMHDAWTNNGSHFLGIFAVFMKKVKCMEGGVESWREELAMPLLSMSPIAKRDEEGEIQSAHAISFDTEAHIRQLESIFNYYHIDVHEWSVCQIADSCALNKCIAVKMSIPHVGCCNLKLALDVNGMVSSPALARTLDAVRTTRRECKSSIKNRAMLYRLSDLGPVLPSATRWSGLCAMVTRFNRIRNELEEVADTDGLELTISRTPRFRAQCKQLAKYLSGINTVTKALQKRGATLDTCRFLLDTLTETIAIQKNNPDAQMYGCTLKDEYTKLHSTHSPSSVFESGVVKIQRNEVDTLTDDERDAFLSLKVQDDTSRNDDDDARSSGEILSMAEIFEKCKRRRRSTGQLYMNLDFMLGSSAEIERLFSVAGGIPESNRQRMTPLLFESLLFLKVNRNYWDAKTVVTAMSNARSDLVAQRVSEDAEQEVLSTM